MPETPTELTIDRNAVLWSASEADRAGRPLLVMLHGYGSDEADMFGMSTYLPLEPVIASVRGPIPEGPGFAWFSRFTNTPGNPRAAHAEAAVSAVLGWLDELPAAPSVGLLGFSQGGALALQLLRTAPERFSYAAILSGFVIDGEKPLDARLAERRMPVFWGRGSQDPFIPSVSVDRTTAWLPGHSALDRRVYEGMGHSVSQRELADVSAFIRGALGA